MKPSRASRAARTAAAAQRHERHATERRPCAASSWNCRTTVANASASGRQVPASSASASRTSATRSLGSRPSVGQQRAVLAGPGGRDVAGDLGVALHAPRGRPDPERLVPVRRGRRQQHRARRQLGDLLPVPLHDPRRGGQRAEDRVAGRLGAEVDGQHAQLGPGSPRAHRRRRRPSASSSAPRQMPNVGTAARDRLGHQRAGRGQPRAARRRPRAPSRRRGPAARAYAGSGRQVLTGVRVRRLQRQPGLGQPVAEPAGAGAPARAGRRGPSRAMRIEQLTAPAGSGRARTA